MNRLVIVWAFSVLLSPGPATASDFFQNRGGHSLTALFGMPSPLTSELSTESHGLHLSINHVNMLAGGDNSDEFLLLDGERTELMFSSTHRLSSRWGLGVKLPFIIHAGGFLDQSIEQWHEWFSLPNGSRGDRSRNQIEISYRDPSGNMLRFNRHDQGIGDMALEFYGAFSCASCRNLKKTPVFRVGLKLPTGSTDDLAGSGATDFYADVTSATTPLGRYWSLRASIGILYTGKSDLFSNQKQGVLYGFLGASYPWSSSIELIAQLDWHSAMFESELVELGEPSVRLVTGAAIKLASNRYLEVALQEDLTPDASPDVGIFVRFRRKR